MIGNNLGSIAIMREREDQILKYGYTGLAQAIRPAYYDRRQLVFAAQNISIEKMTESFAKMICPHNWNLEWWIKLCNKPYMERLAIAGAFIAAEIDRLEAIKQNGVL